MDENRQQSVFGKLNNLDEKIEDIALKLEGISINDLYALAKRTWDYGDYVTAQKYYNHISLLRPIEWKAPLYASLCNFKGNHDMEFWPGVPKQTEDIMVSTIEYIYNFDYSIDVKEKEMSECLKIVKDENIKTRDYYYKYKLENDSEDSGYVYTLEDYISNLYKRTKEINLECMKDYHSFLADMELELIKTTNRISINITKEVFNEFTTIATNKYDINIDEVIKISQNDDYYIKAKLSMEEKNEIKLKGTMYFKYKDKVISNRLFKNRMIMGLLLVILSMSCIILSITSINYLAFVFLVPFLEGVLLVVKANIEKQKIKCSSIFCYNREKTRFTSDGNVIIEEKFSPIKLVFFILLYYIIFLCMGGITLVVSSITDYCTKNLIIGITTILISIIMIISCIKGITEKNHNTYNGVYEFYYKGNYYKF